MALAMARPWKHPKTGIYWFRKRVPDELGRSTGPRPMTRQGAEVERGIPFLKSYAVFNADQIDGLPDRFIPQPPTSIANTTRNARGARAYYSPSHDRIQQPPFASFITAEGYYATLSHELVHWTGHSSRLDRDLSRTRWGAVAHEAFGIDALAVDAEAPAILVNLLPGRCRDPGRGRRRSRSG